MTHRPRLMRRWMLLFRGSTRRRGRGRVQQKGQSRKNQGLHSLRHQMCLRQKFANTLRHQKILSHPFRDQMCRRQKFLKTPTNQRIPSEYQINSEGPTQLVMPLTFSPSNIFLWFLSATILLMRTYSTSPSGGQLDLLILLMCRWQMSLILRRAMNPPLWYPIGESFICNVHMSEVHCITLS